MRRSVVALHVYSLVLLVVAALSGCSWLRKEHHKNYALAPENRPLEMPPDLDLSMASGGMKMPPKASSINQQDVSGSISVKSGFTVAGKRDRVFANVAQVLSDIPGVVVSSKAPALGFYDVGYENENFLVRVSSSSGGSDISVIDSRGMPATGKAATKLMAMIKAKLGG
ncbi:MAG TPA: hypothetical protein ACQGQH_01655 [Xylella sp.]